MDISPEKSFGRLIIGLALLAGLLLVMTSSLPEWGEKRLAHEDSSKTLPVPVGQVVEQTFVWEGDVIDRAVIWIDGDRALPSRGDLRLEFASAGGQFSVLSVDDIPSSGSLIFNFDPPIRGGEGKKDSFKLSLHDADERVYLKYQIDAAIYDEGELVYHPNLKKKGDLSWLIRYRRPTLGSRVVQWGYAGMLVVSGWLIVLGLKWFSWGGRGVMSRGLLVDLLVATLLFIGVTGLYGVSVLKTGIWAGTTDFSKDVSYIRASSEALGQGQWPVWSHYTCGGMQMLGNPEGNTLSLATVTTIMTSASAERSLWLMLAMEAGVAAAGAFLLARMFGVSRLGSVLAGLVTSLSAVYPYKLAEGISMVGGAVAFAPWAWLGLVGLLKKWNWNWAWLSGMSLVMMFWRGDVHIILGVLAVMVTWVAMNSWKNNSRKPWLGLVVIGAFFFIGASVKVLPYLEQPGQMNSVVPHSVQMTQEGLWDDAFLKVDSRFRKIPVSHGLPAHYGYIGSYVGIVVLLLALLGLFRAKEYRWYLGAGLIVVLLLVEGTLFDQLLRHVVPLDSLLRMAVRLMTLLVLLIGLLAGFGLDKLGGLVKYRKLTRELVLLSVVLFVAVDLAIVSYEVLRANMVQRSSKELITNDATVLSPHINFSLESGDEHHASELIRYGYLLPHICGDMNNPPEFLSSIDKPISLSDKSVETTPNVIWIGDIAGSENVVVRERFVSSWMPSAGTVMPSDDGAVELVVPSVAPERISIRFISATMRVQQILLGIVLLMLLFVVIKLRLRSP